MNEHSHGFLEATMLYSRTLSDGFRREDVGFNHLLITVVSSLGFPVVTGICDFEFHARVLDHLIKHLTECF
jgi:hypothetical protein